MMRGVRILSTATALLFAGALSLAGCGEGRDAGTSPSGRPGGAEQGARPESGAGGTTSTVPGARPTPGTPGAP
jgi:hypothetical protein